MGDGVSQETLQATTDLVAAVNAHLLYARCYSGWTDLSATARNALKSFIIQLGFVSAIVPELSPANFLRHTSRHRFMK